MDELIEKRMSTSAQGEKCRKSGSLIPLSSIIQAVYDQATLSAGCMRQSHAISTGLSDLDSVIHSIDKSDLLLIVARPGMGKSALALNMALFAGLSLEKTVAIFSPDTSREQLVSRLFSRTALIPFQSLQACKLNERQQRDFADAANSLKSANIYIDDTPTLTISDMISKCQCIQSLDLVIINSFQLIHTSESDCNCCRMLKSMATELNVPVICTANLSCDIELRHDKRPMLSDLLESGIIEQHADVVIGLYRDSYYNEKNENPYLTEAIVLKNCKGPTGTVQINWLPEYMTFSSIEHGDEDNY